MFESLLEEVNRMYPNKGVLSMDDVCKLLECEKRTVYNWTRRVDPTKRPPRLVIGKTIRFPKVPFIQWLLKEQSTN